MFLAGVQLLKKECSNQIWGNSQMEKMQCITGSLYSCGQGSFLSTEGPIVSPLSSAWTARAWPSTRCQAEYFEDTPAMSMFSKSYGQYLAKLTLFIAKNWYALLGVVCFELWFVVVLVVYDYILRIPQHEQHTGRLFGSCDLGRWTPGWTLRVETSPIQYPNLSFVDDIVDDIIIYHPNSSKFIQHLSISGYHDIIWYHATIRFEDRQVLPIGQGLTVKSAKPAQALDNRRNQASQSCCAWAPAVRGFGFGRCFMRNK